MARAKRRAPFPNAQPGFTHGRAAGSVRTARLQRAFAHLARYQPVFGASASGTNFMATPFMQ